MRVEERLPALLLMASRQKLPHINFAMCRMGAQAYVCVTLPSLASQDKMSVIMLTGRPR